MSTPERSGTPRPGRRRPGDTDCTKLPRGALCHWVVIKDRRVANYQCVVPGGWNSSPRDGKGQRGPYESALLNTPIADPNRPLEILRTIHSFDPCMACAIHLVDSERKEILKVRAL